MNPSSPNFYLLKTVLLKLAIKEHILSFNIENLIFSVIFSIAPILISDNVNITLKLTVYIIRFIVPQILRTVSKKVAD